MKYLKLFPFCVFLAACGAEDNPVTTGADGAVRISMQQGLNCYGGNCFRYEKSIGSVEAPGRVATRAPANLNSVSESEFNALFNKAMSARWRRDSDR